MKTSTNQYSNQMLKELLRTKISNQINSINNPKCLYANRNILNIINYVFDLQFGSKGIRGNIYTLQYDPEEIDVDKANHVIFFLYPQPRMMEVLASMILKNEGSYVKKEYHVYLVPNKNYLCMQRLQKLNIVNKINLKSFNFDLIPLKQDLYSLQVPRCLDILEQRQLIVKSLLKLSNINGKFISSFGFGQQSKIILNKLEKELEGIPEIKEENKRSYLIMMDRELDYITPMLTPFTYEGLLDLLFGINMHLIEIPGNLIESKKNVETFLLNNPLDRSYEKIASMPIRQVPQYLKEKSKQLHEEIKKKKQQAKSLEQLNDINDDLMKQYLILQYHKNIVSFVLEKLNDCQLMDTVTHQTTLLQNLHSEKNLSLFSIFYPIEQVLKLEIIASQVSQTGSYYYNHEKQLIQFVLESYPIEHFLTLKNLVDKGILRSSKKPLKWKQMCQKLDLIPDNPHAYTEIYLIYSCLLVRYIELFLTKKITPEMKNLITPDTYENGYMKARAGDTIFVYMIGGVTVGECEAFRFLAKKLRVQIIICTTEQTSGTKIIKHCFPADFH